MSPAPEAHRSAALDTRGSAIHPPPELRVDHRRVKTAEIGGMTVSGAAGTLVRRRWTAANLGPTARRASTETPSRRFRMPAGGSGGASPPARRILYTIARRAFRRKVGPSDVKPFLTSSKLRRRNTASISIAALASLPPAPFCFASSSIRPAPPGQRTKSFPVGTSFAPVVFLWSSIPDDGLLGAARAGGTTARPPRHWVRRMLAADTTTAMFISPNSGWGCALAETKPDPMAFPDFDGALAAFRKRRVFSWAASSAGIAACSICSPRTTYLNEKLARLCGFPVSSDPASPPLAAAPSAEDSEQGSILLLTSHKTTASPILRGK